MSPVLLTSQTEEFPGKESGNPQQGRRAHTVPERRIQLLPPSLSRLGGGGIVWMECQSSGFCLYGNIAQLSPGSGVCLGCVLPPGIAPHFSQLGME